MPYSHVAASAARCRRDHCLVLWTRLLVTAAARRRLGEPAVPAKRGGNGWLLASRIGSNALYIRLSKCGTAAHQSRPSTGSPRRVCAARRQPACAHLPLTPGTRRGPGGAAMNPQSQCTKLESWGAPKTPKVNAKADSRRARGARGCGGGRYSGSLEPSGVTAVRAEATHGYYDTP